ncbi:MAG: hypothetical protein E7Z86_05530 [Methanosphaera stadtmanae]|nr:hypothetical protein [Methanosphaera stadtmanae]
MSDKKIKAVEIIKEYDGYKNVIIFNQTIYQNKTKKSTGDGYYYTLKTVVPRVIYDYLEIIDDIIYLIQKEDSIQLSATPANMDPTYDKIYKRKLNKKSHNFTIPKQLFTEDSTSSYVARFIFIPETSQVQITFI